MAITNIAFDVTHLFAELLADLEVDPAFTEPVHAVVRSRGAILDGHAFRLSGNVELARRSRRRAAGSAVGPVRAASGCGRSPGAPRAAAGAAAGRGDAWPGSAAGAWPGPAATGTGSAAATSWATPGTGAGSIALTVFGVEPIGATAVSVCSGWSMRRQPVPPAGPGGSRGRDRQRLDDRVGRRHPVQRAGDGRRPGAALPARTRAR